MHPDPQSTFHHLRLTRTAWYEEYLQNTRRWREVGNEQFAEFVRTSPAAAGTTSAASEFRLYHAWLPGTIELNAEDATAVSLLMSDIVLDGYAARQDHWRSILKDRGWLEHAPPDLDGLVKRSMEEIIAIQNPRELREFLEVVRDLAPKTVLEIGTARGGMLYCFCQLAAPDALLVSLDLPGAPNCGGQTQVERSFFSSFRQPGQVMHFIPDNSHNHTSRERLRSILGDRKVDLMFIDGDHSYGGVRIDCDMYAEFLSPDGIMVLHDICLLPEHWGGGNEVGEFWKEYAPRHRVREIIDPDGICRPDRPPGVIPCWGIGIVYDGNANATAS